MTAHRQAIKLAEPDQTMNGDHPQLKLLMPKRHEESLFGGVSYFQSLFVLMLTLAQLDRLNCIRAGNDSSCCTCCCC